MIYNYEPLIITLKEKGMTRIQLQNDLQLSSATMAKMNAGKAVSMETVGRICDLLQCGINKVVEITPVNEPLERWACLGKTSADGKEQTFKIYLYYRSQNSKVDGDTATKLSEFTENQETEKTEEHLNVTYLYGYATPHHFGEADMYTWYLSRGKEKFKEFYKLDGTLYAKDLRKLVDAAMHCSTLQEICELLDVNIHIENVNADAVKAILNSRIANGQFVYRPPFYLPPDSALISFRKDCRPMASFISEEATICECLYGINKQQYYFDYDAKQPDQQKAQLLWEYLTEELPLHGSINEMARLSNFEILTKPHRFTEKLVTCELWCEDDIPVGVEVTVNKKLTGKHILHVKISDSNNAIFDNAYIIDPQNDVENPLQIPLSESYFCAELKLWSIGSANTGVQRLLFDSCTTYIREIRSSLNIAGRSFKLEDSWTRAMKKQNKTVGTSVSFYTDVNMKPLVNPWQEPWITEEHIVQDDFRELQERIYSSHSKDAFFPKGIDRILLFIDWLKKRLKNLPDTAQVILFDPYINSTAIDKYIRSISNPAVQYEIVTDSNPTGEKERTKQIEEIRNLPASLCYLCYPCRLRVRTVTYKDGLLHDRVLIIAGPETAEVYILSNSLDAMAKKHSSTLTAVNPDIAKEIVKNYAELVKQAEDDGEIDTLFDTTDPTPVLTVDKDIVPDKESNSEDDEYYTPEDFYRDYSNNATEKALAGLSFMYSKEKNDCISYIMSLNNVEEEYNKLETFLKEKIKTLSAPRLNTGHDILTQNILAEADGLTHLPGAVGEICHPFYALIDSASVAIDWSFNNKRAVPGACYYAVSILWKLSAEMFVHLLEELIEERKKEKAEDINNVAMPTSIACMVYTMLKCIIRSVAVPDEEARNFTTLVNSHTPYLRAVFAAKVLRFDEDFLTALIQGKQLANDADLLITTVKNRCAILAQVMKAEEACLALLFMFTRLQMICKRGQIVANRAQILLDEIATVYTDTVLKHIKSDVNCLKQQLAPINMLNPEDVCRIIDRLQKAKYLTAEQEYEVLLHFWKLIYDKDNNKEKAYYNESTLRQSIFFARYISRNSKVIATKLLKEISNNRIRKLCTLLYDPLLYTKNYNKWKNAVDQCACLLVTERQIVSQFEGLTIGKGEAEYEKLTENNAEMLEKCSIVYRIWKEGKGSTDNQLVTKTQI